MPTRSGNLVSVVLLGSEQRRSVLHALDARRQSSSFAYTPYGHRCYGAGLLVLLGFNGEKAERLTGHYLLGNGYRAFNPGLMRFNSPDNLSPFGSGGINAYVYCLGDPVNRQDRTGHIPQFLKPLLRATGIIKKSSTNAASRVGSGGAQARVSAQLSEEKGPSSLQDFAVPRPQGAGTQNVAAWNGRLKQDASALLVNTHTVTVADQQGNFVRNLGISRRDADSIMFEIARKELAGPTTIQQRSDVIRRFTGLDDRADYVFIRFEDLTS